ncbi:hypothetical protein PVK06_034356 [Gossypium arboreum]|uniref:Uncharacterized protein n=1 Tax=Gossypium arboreum TaxID=29729 RepID=A0ABR0NGW0_GOSAR|nr:hypothetical protein PVK06_034356 [Gossypium arboreum]
MTASYLGERPRRGHCATVVKVLCIPLAREAHNDTLVWGEKASVEYSVRNAYRLLHRSRSSNAYDIYKPLFTKL